MSAYTVSKAQRLLDQGRVQRDPDRPRLFHVQGDHGTYDVVIGVYARWCTCRRVHGIAGDRVCSHIEAALAMEAEASA